MHFEEWFEKKNGSGLKETPAYTKAKEAWEASSEQIIGILIDRDIIDGPDVMPREFMGEEI